MSERSAPHGAPVAERNRYFTGKFMAARDFAADTEYLLDRHRLHNRLLHGWGIVCGLDVRPHPRPECAREWVVVTAGFAIDCHGRELVLAGDTAFRLPLPPGPDSEPLGEDCPPRHDPFLLCARFSQEKIEPVPALYAEGTCDPHHTEYNRYREGVRLVVADVTPACWPTAECGCDDEKHHGEDCGCGCHGNCFEPHCPCGDLVPLARVVPHHHGGGYRLDLDGRRVQPPPPAMLTHVTGINWPHGGRVTPHELRRDMDGKLRIRFDRPLRKFEDCGARGVNEYTFVVQFSGSTQALEYVPFPDGKPPELEDDGCTAVFTIDDDYLNERGRRGLRDVVVHVSLRCDFIPDCRGIPVDGNHLRGRLPSGDGVQGGLFESWFEVREHHHHHDHHDGDEEGAEA
ncbi:hypothetical protein [Amycolatopsis sp. NPDC021455]|uniref:hypothetical protein n=1 Tax=Amycolatopsis sp. NPDC021455 TaxID=3154901 RepID=UPI0033D66F14